MNRQGFTLVEMVIAILILTVTVLGIGASAGRVLQAASSTEVKAEALQAVEDQIGQIVMDPRYAALDTLYAGTDTNLPGLPAGYQRVTKIKHTQAPGESGRLIDYKEITVTVSGAGLPAPITRTIVIAAP
ncbi:MAG: prepilin-type N-terminal cleavage/methylation domain-containing protein [Gemmatimonadetes bacterium]|nr:MAG: prepilin-type N-terminal cleavage/methylation domain-containing protein [Gemmatimonadota bacterium]